MAWLPSTELRTEIPLSTIDLLRVVELRGALDLPRVNELCEAFNLLGVVELCEALDFLKVLDLLEIQIEVLLMMEILIVCDGMV
jgi:hypothetical protein